MNPIQQDLPLPLWGGARRGAGRKRKSLRKDVPHVARRKFRRGTLHVTARMRREVGNLRTHRCFRAIKRALERRSGKASRGRWVSTRSHRRGGMEDRRSLRKRNGGCSVWASGARGSAAQPDSLATDCHFGEGSLAITRTSVIPSGDASAVVPTAVQAGCGGRITSLRAFTAVSSCRARSVW